MFMLCALFCVVFAAAISQENFAINYFEVNIHRLCFFLYIIVCSFGVVFAAAVSRENPT